jgi:hypothetical protein
MRIDPVHGTAERPIQPEIPRSQFARGMAKRPTDPEAMPLGRFSEGQEKLHSSHTHPHRGRFSEGQEALGDEDPRKHIRRRYSEGLETRA